MARLLEMMILAARRMMAGRRKRARAHRRKRIEIGSETRTSRQLVKDLQL
jgi:hypothetical protein